MDHDSALYRPGLERSNCCANAPAKLSLSCATFAALMTLPLMTANAEQMTAIVRTPDRKPADKATVVMADTGSIVSVSNGEIVKTDDVIFRRQTDSAGRVDLTHESRPARPIPRRMVRRGMGHDDSWLVVVHPSGFAGQVCVEGGARSHSACALGTDRRNLPGRPKTRVEPLSAAQGNSSAPALDLVDWFSENRRERTIRYRGLMAGHASLSESDDDFEEKERAVPVSSEYITMILIAGQTRHADFGTSGRPVIGQLRHSAGSKENALWSSAIIMINPDIHRPVEGKIDFTGRADRNGNFSINDVPEGR
jgi:hypothetical protein